MDDYKKSPLWQHAFRHKKDGFIQQRNLLETSFDEFRARVSLLVSQINIDMPSLTVHDITHIDALWWTASEIAGPKYPLNPAEAFVLGGAFLLHDAAHCIAAYSGGVEEIRSLPEWKDFAVKSGIADENLTSGTEQFQLVLFDTLRTLHPKQARRLAKRTWKAPGDDTELYLLPHDDLRQSYGDAIGKLAETHWWSHHELESLNHMHVNPPTCLHPATWVVDILKLAALLRTADAAHIDAQRAPRFLIALVQPGGSSLDHWRFQSKIHKVKLDPDQSRHDLSVSGSSFSPEEQDAWWMAYDASRMIDRELRAADRLLMDLKRERFAARSVMYSYSPEAFSRNVPAGGWQPVDTSIKITDIKSMVERFGGEKLYGKDPAAALRELMQNAVDAIHACRNLGGLGDAEGEIEIAVDDAPEGHWIHVTDTGIGMSRYVLTEVLLDFGRSLWRSAELSGEWSGLSASGFEAIGQFGIGFFSVFMLGERVRVVTRRYENKEGEKNNQWLLEFTAGTNKRPILRTPSENEKLKRHGTRVSVLVSTEKMDELRPKRNQWMKDSSRFTLAQVCARIAPAVDIDVTIRVPGEKRQYVIRANDWLTLPPVDLLKRVSPWKYESADKDKFGEWSYLSELNDHTGKLVGRCAVQNIYYADNDSIGVVKGLLAGTIQGVAGVVFSKPQNDLARKTAVPDVSLMAIQQWAEGQKKTLLQHGQISENISAVLARFGADYEGLTVGRLAGSSVSFGEFVIALKSASFIYVHEGDVGYDEDDEVLKRDFENSFVAKDFLLELASRRAPNWLDQIDDKSICRDTWSLDAACEYAIINVWGEVDWSEDKVSVGSVDGADIYRNCRVASKKETAEDQNLSID
jgi:hypothetical protein